MAESRRSKEWLRYGCGGCLVFLLLGAVASAVMLGIVFVGGGSGEVEERTLAPDVPVPPVPAGEVSAGEVSAGESLGEEAPLPPSGPAGVGRVILDVQQAEFFVEPGPPGESLRVQARYDREACELREELDPAGEPGWVYRVRFYCERRSLLQNMRSWFGEKKEKVRVFLPPDQPLALEIRGSQGGTILELGGLWLTSLEVDFQMGGLVMAVGSPLREPLESMSLSGSMGGLVANSLGNASPRRLEVDYRMGGMELDLRGQWVTDADIEIDLRMGGGNVTLPEGVRIEGVPSAPSALVPAAEIPPPTLRFTTNAVQGNLEFSDGVRSHIPTF
jgi:hypothetical protein